MSVIADLIRAGVDPELVGRVADEIAKARAEGAANAAPVVLRTAREERNRRYYEAHRDELRLKASERRLNKTIKTDSDVGADQALAHPLTTQDNPELLPKSPPMGGQKGKVQPSRRTRIASDAQPTSADRKTANEAGMSQPTFRVEWGLFRDRHVADGSTMANWEAAWRTWVGNWVKWGCRQHGAPAVSARAAPPERSDSIASGQDLLARIRASREQANRTDPDRNGPEIDATPLAISGR